ncbi:MAG TPA: hypothetical protein PLR41_06820 [Alphaproteobacteria bacterium]|nr:hypothetical protein [Alphaproteobacteria bacterium]
MSRRLLPAADGSLMAESDKLAALETLGRLSNESRAVYEVWLQAQSGGKLPRYDDLHLKPVLALMPNVLVVDVLDDPRDYRYRQVGWREVEARTTDPTGLTVRQVYEGEGLDFVLENYNLAVDNREAFVDFSIDITASQRYVETETLFLPLSQGGGTVTQVLVYSHFLDRPKISPVRAEPDI